MPFWKINHEHGLEWVEGDNDFFTFIVIVFERETKFGFSTYAYSNSKKATTVTKKFNVIGHFTIHPASQLDVKIETDITCLRKGMKIVNRNALRAFLDANSHRPLTCMNLAEILSDAEAVNLQVNASILSYPSP